MGRPVMTLPLFWLLPEAKALALTPDDEPATAAAAPPPKPSLALARAMASALALAVAVAVAAAAVAAAAVSSSFSFSFLASTAAGIDINVVGDFRKVEPEEVRISGECCNIDRTNNQQQEQKSIANKLVSRASYY